MISETELIVSGIMLALEVGFLVFAITFISLTYKILSEDKAIINKLNIYRPKLYLIAILCIGMYCLFLSLQVTDVLARIVIAVTGLLFVVISLRWWDADFTRKKQTEKILSGEMK